MGALRREGRLAAMASEARALGAPNAAHRVVDVALRIAGGSFADGLKISSCAISSASTQVAKALFKAPDGVLFPGPL